MLDELSSYYTKATPVIIPDWTYYVKTLEYQKDLLQKRYTLAETRFSSSVNLLNNIATSIDYSYLRNLPNDFTRYNYYFKHHEKVFKNLFDPVSTGRGYKNLFYDTNKDTIEYLIPVDDVDHLKVLPLGSEWTIWSTLKPVTIWYHDSLEYTLNLQSDKIKFVYDKPTFSTIFIDVTMLTFMYFKYLVHTRPTGLYISSKNFISHFVFSKLFDDLQDIWLFNLIDKAIDLSHMDSKSLKIQLDSLLRSDRNYGYKGDRCITAIESLIKKINEIRDGKIRPENLINSPLFRDNKSLRDKILYSFEYLDIPHLNQYRYLELMRDLPALGILVKLYNLRRDDQTYYSLFKTLKIKVDRLLNNSVTSRINNKDVKDHVNKYIDNLKAITENTNKV